MDVESSDARRGLAERLERFVRARGWTTDELAARARVKPSELAALFGGTEEVGVSVILRLAGALGVEVDDLIGGIDWVPGPNGGEYRISDPGED
jgi:transcriptional regulator with XRE-family HTH domain